MILICSKGHTHDTTNPWNWHKRPGDRCGMELSYDRLRGVTRCRLLVRELGAPRRWACLTDDGTVVAVGVTAPDKRFDRCACPMSVATYCYWVKHGHKYCEVFGSLKPLRGPKGLPHHTVTLEGIRHGPMRYCQMLWISFHRAHPRRPTPLMNHLCCR